MANAAAVVSVRPSMYVNPRTGETMDPRTWNKPKAEARPRWTLVDAAFHSVEIGALSEVLKSETALRSEFFALYAKSLRIHAQNPRRTVKPEAIVEYFSAKYGLVDADDEVPADDGHVDPIALCTCGHDVPSECQVHGEPGGEYFDAEAHDAYTRAVREQRWGPGDDGICPCGGVSCDGTCDTNS
jgi:hypothetical protein